jgi:hypothetical protein
MKQNVNLRHSEVWMCSVFLCCLTSEIYWKFVHKNRMSSRKQHFLQAVFYTSQQKSDQSLRCLETHIKIRTRVQFYFPVHKKILSASSTRTASNTENDENLSESSHISESKSYISCLILVYQMLVQINSFICSKTNSHMVN